MNTPITDAAETKRMDPDVSVVYGTVPAHVARRLELDRAALMEALESVMRYSTPSASVKVAARSALAAVRASFPTT